MLKGVLPTLYCFGENNLLVVLKINPRVSNVDLTDLFIGFGVTDKKVFFASINDSMKFVSTHYSDNEKLEFLFVGARWKDARNTFTITSIRYVSDIYYDIYVTIFLNGGKERTTTLHDLLTNYSPVTAT